MALAASSSQASSCVEVGRKVARAASTRCTAACTVARDAPPSAASVTSAAASRKTEPKSRRLARSGSGCGPSAASAAANTRSARVRSPASASAAATCALAIGVFKRVELGVGEIAQIADRRRAVARQHVERVGKIAAIVLARIRRRADDVAQAIERKPERRFGHGEFAFARAGEKIGDVGIEPDVVTAADTPEPEGAGGILPREQHVDGVADALIGAGLSATCVSLARSLR